MTAMLESYRQQSSQDYCGGKQVICSQRNKVCSRELKIKSKLLNLKMLTFRNIGGSISEALLDVIYISTNNSIQNYH